MMFGSMLYSSISNSASSLPTKHVLIYTLIAASLCFFLPAHVREENVVLWCFCVFEVCCGIYYPAMGSLKSKLIEDGMRASVYTILRVPLNAFVVLALSMTQEGKSPHALRALQLAGYMHAADANNCPRRAPPQHGLYALQWATASGSLGCLSHPCVSPFSLRHALSPMYIL
jgi:hypothetical protein